MKSGNEAVNLTAHSSNLLVRRTHLLNSKSIFIWSSFCVSGSTVRNPVLIRRSMQLIKELTDILREIISSGDEERLRRLEEIVRRYTAARKGVENRLLH